MNVLSLTDIIPMLQKANNSIMSTWMMNGYPSQVAISSGKVSWKGVITCWWHCSSPFTAIVIGDNSLFDTGKTTHFWSTTLKLKLLIKVSTCQGIIFLTSQHNNWHKVTVGKIFFLTPSHKQRWRGGHGQGRF